MNSKMVKRDKLKLEKNGDVTFFIIFRRIVLEQGKGGIYVGGHLMINRSSSVFQYDHMQTSF